MNKHTLHPALLGVVAAMMVLAGTTTLLSANMSMRTVRSAAVSKVGPAPAASKIKRIPQGDVKAWTTFCKATIAPADSAIPAALRKAGKTPSGMELPAVSRIRLLSVAEQRPWTIFCTEFLRAKTASSSSSAKKKHGAAVPLRGAANTVPPAIAPATSVVAPASAATSAAPSVSSPAASGYKGACLVRDPNVGVPSAYALADVGSGYAKLGKGDGFTSFGQAQNACVVADYNALIATHCASRPGQTYETGVLMYTQQGDYHMYGGSPVVAPRGTCPQASSVSSPAATGYKGACVIRNAYTGLPQYDAPDAGTGYAKLNKGSGFANYTAVRDACSLSDYAALDQTFCAQNPGGSYQMGVAMYNQDNTYNTTGCGNAGCNWVQCSN
jgi:hypothetical protein